MENLNQRLWPNVKAKGEKVGNFYRNVFNFWVIFITLAVFTSSVHGFGINKEDRPSLEEILLEADSELSDIDKKIKRLGLKKTEEEFYSNASWYGSKFHGRPTASAELYDKNLLTAAHKTLPLNTYVLVTNMINGKETVVRVNDRGPFIAGRDLDLSESAAKMIGAIAYGVIPIKYEVLDIED